MSDTTPQTNTDNRTLVGVMWMLAAGLSFVAVTALVKLLGDRIPPAQSAFLRYVLALVFIVPVLPKLFGLGLSFKIHAMLFVRGLLQGTGVIFWFFAMGQIPLAEVTAMNYLTPVIVTIGAALFLGEPLAMRRIAAICVALIGAAIILRPGFREITLGHLSMLMTVTCFGCSFLVAKSLSGKTSATVIVTGLSLWVTVMLAPIALAVWVTPTLWELTILLGVACFATLGHYTMTYAFAAAPVTATQPVTFLNLLWATALGLLFFNESVDVWVLAGAGLIMSAVSFITWREAMLQSARSSTKNS